MKPIYLLVIATLLLASFAFIPQAKNESTATVQFSTSAAGVLWGDSYTVTMIRTGDASGACSVDLKLTGGSANPSQDYQTSDTLPHTVHFAPGETQQTFVVSPVWDYLYTKGIKNIVFGLSNFQGADAGSLDTLTLTISHSLVNVNGVNGVTPSDGSDYVPTTTVITASFDNDVESVDPASFTLTDSAGNLVAGSISVEDGKATFQPDSPLASGVKYTAMLTGIFDTNGDPLASDFTWSFTTEPVAPQGKVEWVRGGSVLDTDTTSDLTNAHRWPVKNGDAIRIYSGIYSVNRFLVYGASVTIQGIDTGWGKPIIDSNGATGFMFEANGVTVDNIRFRNATDSITYPQVANIWAPQSDNLVVKNCIFENSYEGLEMPASQTSENGPLFGDNHVKVINCIFNMGSTGNEGIYSYYGVDVTIDGCTFNGPMATLMCVDGAVVSNSNFKGYGLSATYTGTKNTDNVNVKDCTFSGSSLAIQGYGIGSEGLNYEITGCHFLDGGRIQVNKADGVNIHDNEVKSGWISVGSSKNVAIRNINDELDLVADNVNAGIGVDTCPGAIIDKVHVRLYSSNAGGSSVLTVSMSDNAKITNSVSSGSSYQSQYGTANTEGIRISNSNGVTVENCNASDNGGCGIDVYHQNGNPSCSGNTIKNCTFDNNYYNGGILINGADGNTFTGNEVCGNSYGIYIMGDLDNSPGKNNLIYNNTFVGNNNDGLDQSAPGTNHFNSLAKNDYTYEGQAFNNYMGNYWSGYAGSDSNSDGIGDTAYTNVNILDNYPMILAPVPVADFMADPASGNAPLDVAFTDKSTNSPTAWDWDFGDGSQHSNKQNPTHTYNDIGHYTVTLTASNVGGKGTPVSKVITVTAVAPTADFTATPRTGSEPLTVDFTDMSTGRPTGWSWDFGDGSTSDEQNPTHIYDDEGNYEVTLTASNAQGSSEPVSKDVTVPAILDSTAIGFTSAEVTADEGTTVHIMLQRSGDTSGESSVLVTDIGGTAVKGTNYIFTPVRITFVAGQANSGFDVALPGVAFIESVDNSVIFSLSAPINAVLGNQKQCNLTIHEISVTPISIHNLRSGQGFNTIQSAIDDPGRQQDDIIEVGSGIYPEALTITGKVILHGLDTGAGKPRIDGTSLPGRNLINISTAGGTEISGFSLANSQMNGIHIQCQGITIRNCDISGSALDGLLADADLGNTAAYMLISWCNFTHNNNGLHYQSTCQFDTISDCRFDNNVNAGFLLGGNCYDDTIRDCEFAGNGAQGIRLDPASANTLINNIVHGNTGAGILITGAYNIVQDNRIYSNGAEGIRIDTDNLYCNNNNNTILDNDIHDNSHYGISVLGKDNQIYGNSFRNNAPSNAFYDPGTSAPEINTWYSRIPIGYTYNSVSHTSPVGNYWDGATGGDRGDGIRVNSYAVGAGASDLYPLAHLSSDYTWPSAIAPISWGFSGHNDGDPAMMNYFGAGWSFNDPTAVQWDFGDGSAPVEGDYSVYGNVKHQFSQPGLYLITLNVSNAAGISTSSWTENVAGTTLPTISFSSASVTGDEGTTVHIMLHRAGDSSGTATVLVSNIGGTAIPGKNYTFTPVTLFFDVNQQNSGFDVLLPSNSVVEPQDTTVIFGLSDPDKAVLGTPDQCTLTIHDTSDVTPPVTTFTHSATEGTNGWYTSRFDVFLNAVDTGTGVKLVAYQLDGRPWALVDGSSLSFGIVDNGIHTLRFNSTDFAGNREADQTVTIKIDSVKPSTVCTLNTDPGLDHGTNGWNQTDVVVDLLASDPVPPALPSSPEYQAESSHPGYFIYQVDGGQWIKVNANHWQFTVAGSGIHTVSYNSIDYAGNAEANKTVTVKIDKDAPTFDFNLWGTLGADGWYTGPVTASVEAADAASGVQQIGYKPDASAWNAVASAYVSCYFATDGTHTFRFNVTDVAGNRYSDQISTFKIDQTGPETGISLAGTAGNNSWYRSTVTVTLTASDGAGSGVATRYYQIDSLGWNAYDPLDKPVIGEGTHTISYYSVDVLGNTETTHTRTVKVDMTPPTVNSISPAAGAIDIPVATTISVTFSEDIDQATFSGSIKDSHGTLVAGTPSYANGVITFTPSSQLTRATTYTMTVDAVKDMAGNPLAAPYSWSFTTIPRAPVANIMVNQSSGYSPLCVQFTDNSNNVPTSWSWSFGDGATSTARNPLHTYASQGTYTVTLTATNAGGSGTTQQQITAYPRNDSQILSITGPPSEMITGRTYCVNVSVKNTGESTWKPFYANIEENLLCDAQVNAMAWYVDGVWLQPNDGYYNSLFSWSVTPSKSQVAPGETVWYNYTFTPHDPYTVYPPMNHVGLSWGQHTLTFRMLGVAEPVQSPSYTGVYFGESQSASFSVRGPVDNSQLVTVNCPSTMFLEQPNTVTITLRNTGDTTWDYHDPGPIGSLLTPGYVYDLKFRTNSNTWGDGPDDMEPYVSFTKTRSKNVVQPGEEVTYTFTVTPHAYPGDGVRHYTIDCRMLGYRQMEDMWVLDYFGQTATLDFDARKQVDNATILSVIAPSEMLSGRTYFANVSVKNTGESTWKPFYARIEEGMMCDAMVNSMAWYVDGTLIQPNDGYYKSLFVWTMTTSKQQVAPGETVWYNYTFTPNDPYDVIPPNNRPGLSWGQHTLTFRMLGVAEAKQVDDYVKYEYTGTYFGSSMAATFNVRGPVDNSQVVSVNCPSTMFLEQPNTVTVTLRNTGDTTWDYSAPYYAGDISTPGNVYDLKIGVGGTSVGDGPDDLENFISFSKTRSKNVVKPGEDVVYTFTITPHNALHFSLDCRMLGYRQMEDMQVLDYFGQTANLAFDVRKQIDNAIILSVSAPSEMLTGRTYNVNVSVKNTGESTWKPFYANIEEGVVCDANVNTLAWYVDGASYAPNDGSYKSLFDWTETSSKAQVAPGETVWYNYTFTPKEPYTLYPPMNGAGISWGSHTLTFNMLGVAEAGTSQWYTGVYFGENRLATFNVRAPVDNASVVSVNYPDTMYLGKESTVTIRLRNTGETTWKYTPMTLYFQNNAPWNDIYDFECGVPAQSAPPTVPSGLTIVKTRSKDTIAPGEDVIYTLKITPSVLGQHSFDCRMLGVGTYEDGVMYLKYFGDTTRLNITAVSLNDIRVTAISPSNGATDVSRTTTVTATFDRDMKEDSLKACFKLFDNSNNGVAGAVVYSGRTATFTPSQPLVNGEHYTAQLNGVTDVNGGVLDTYSWGFRVVYAIPTGNPGGPTLIPTATPTPFQMKIGGATINFNGDHITGPPGSDISGILTNGHVTVPAGSGSLTLDITVGTPKNTGTITGVHVADSSPGTVRGSPASVTVTADLDSLPSGSVTFGATISDPPSESLRGYSEWLSGRGREVSGTPLAEIDVQKSGFTNADIVAGTAKITLTVRKPAGFDRRKPYTVIRHGDDGYEELTATYKSETADTVTFEIVSPNGFSTFLLAETAAAPTPVVTVRPPVSPTPVPGPGFLLIGLAVAAGVMIMKRVRKN